MNQSPEDKLPQLVREASAGHEAAQRRLLDHACDRLRRLTRKMLRSFPLVHRWEQTDDVLQNALLRLHRALTEAQPQTTEHFFNLAATQIRRELLDLAKHYKRESNFAANHHTDGQPSDDVGGTIHNSAEQPETVEEWELFHEQIEELPESERMLFDLLWYQGISQDEAAHVLGISNRTIKRRWQAAKISLHEALKEEACDDG